MSTATAAPVDPIAMLASLSAAELEDRIRRLRADDAALRVMLRAARARERRQSNSKTAVAEGQSNVHR